MSECLEDRWVREQPSQSYKGWLESEVATLQAKLTSYEAAIDAAQGMVAWSYNNFDIDHCEPFDNLKEALEQTT